MAYDDTAVVIIRCKIPNCGLDEMNESGFSDLEGVIELVDSEGLLGIIDDASMEVIGVTREPAKK